MHRRMLIETRHKEEIRVALVDNHTLFDFDVDSIFNDQRVGNFYLATVARREPSLNAAFVSYGSEKHGFLPLKEIAPEYFEHSGGDPRHPDIRDLKEGTKMIIQINKEERGGKGAAVSTYVSLAGCYLVLMPNNERAGGISRRIEGDDRQQLKEIMRELNAPEGMGVIVRTAGVGRSIEELKWDLEALLKLWDAIKAEAQDESKKAPFLIYRESDVILRSVRDYLRQGIDEIIVDTPEAYEEVMRHIQRLRPDFAQHLKLYTEDKPLFAKYRIEHQVESAYAHEVTLPSGGSLVIDHTEALTSVDINSARATKGGDIEETALQTNIEAAQEFARQARLRDIGGLIVIDFIDMIETQHQRQVEEALMEAFKNDRARLQFGRISKFGLMEMSRQRLRPSLGESSDIKCPRCTGHGVIRTVESLTLSILRQLEDEALQQRFQEIHVQLPLDVATFMLNEKRSFIHALEQKYQVRVALIPNPDYQVPHFSNG
ncbi:MAG: Rne/Rng family ribonuclease, partial [Gammaproteobacteria bacterium]|nr:Rne/Rng family ribonuclease [Gammaproteobacteria bacterium]